MNGQRRIPRAARRFAALLIAGGAVFIVAGRAGHARQQTPPTFTRAVDLIQLDVSVVDKNHQPVRGLTQHDFTINEDGKPQPIQTFAAIDLPEDPVLAPGWTRDVAPDVTSNTGVDEERLVVILMDDFAPDIKTDAVAVKNAKDIGRGVIDHLGPRDLAAVVYLVATGNNQEFTHDRARLLTAVEKFSPGASYYQSYIAIGILQRVAEVLGTVAQRRKTLVWVSPGWPGSNDYYLLSALQRANVNVYPVDPSGLKGALPSAPPGGNTTANGGLVPPGGQPNPSEISQFNDRAMALRELLRTMAQTTGGHAFTGWNGFKSSVNQVFRETGSFYLLGYVSSNPTPDGKFRKLQVKVNRPGMTIGTRSGYYGGDPPTTRRSSPALPSSAVQALSGLVPKRGVSLHLFSAPFAIGGAPAVAVALGVPAPQGAPDDVDVVLEAFTFDGVLKQTSRLQAHLQPAASGNGAPADAQILARVDLPPGRYQLRAGVTSTRSRTSGSVFGDLDVPDFAKAPLSLSGVVLSPAPAPVVAAQSETFTPLMPVVPTTSRNFARTDLVSTFVRVYQGGRTPLAAVSIALSIKDEHDNVVVNQPGTIAAEKFDPAARAADYRIALPIAQLPAGSYLLTIEATMNGATVARDVKFDVR